MAIKVNIDNTRIYIEGEIIDTDIHSFIESSSDPDGDIERALKVGIQILKRHEASEHLDYIRSEGKDILFNIHSQLEIFTKDLVSTFQASIHPHEQGSLLNVATQSVRDEVRTFKEVVEEVVRHATQDIVNKQQKLEELHGLIDQQFSEGNTNSFIYRLKSYLSTYFDDNGEISNILKKELRLETGSDTALSRLYRDLSSEIQQFRDVMMREMGFEEGVKSTTQKGFDFEDVLYDELCRLAKPHSDIVEFTGQAAEIGGSKKGDFLYSASSHKIVLDAKHFQQVTSLPALLKYLDECLETRQAQFAIAVVPDVESMQKQMGIWNIYGNRIITPIDYLEISIKYAKGILAIGQNKGDNLDEGWMLNRLDDIQRKMKDISSIKSKLTKLQNGVKSTIEDVQGNLDALKQDTMRLIDNMVSHLNGKGGAALFDV